MKTEKNLITMTEEWMRLERKTDLQRKKAEDFYEKNLMNLITQDYIERNANVVLETVDYLIMSVGTSYEPLVLNIQLLKPQRVLFLCTNKTEQFLEKIVNHCKLKADTYQKTIVNESSPEDVYREIKRAFVHWERPKKMYIDFTGGTKAMSAAAAMAGAMIDVQLIYVGSTEYLVDFRKPKPGSETLFTIDNPLSVFGDLEIEKAFVLFRKCNYSGAKEKLELLKESVPDPAIRQQLNFVYLLANVYEYWDALDFGKAYSYSEKLVREVLRDRKINPKFLLVDKADVFVKQKEYLEALSEINGLMKAGEQLQILTNHKYSIPLMFSMCQNAMIREEQEKLDMATLLLYRLLEMIEQSRLGRFNLYVSRMRYDEILYHDTVQMKWSKIPKEERFEALKERYFEIKKELFGKVLNKYIPDQISLLEGFILLTALGDEICVNEMTKPVDKLKRIRAMVYLRNNSIFAHGLGPVSAGDYQKFRQFVLELFMDYCKIEGINFNEIQAVMKWITPFDSSNYSGMEVN